MSASALPPTIFPPPPPVPSESIEHERVIQRQLGRTSLHVRLVDLASSVAVWAIGVLALLLVAALFDHLVGLRISGRFFAFVILVVGSISFLIAYVGPLLLKTINPAYSARTIEEATPSLKNSLINFLLLRQDHCGLKEIVYQAVEQQAASDIAVVPVETTIDRSRLIRAGYVLCGVMALLAAYKILSPKDPFQTAARVLAPWADIARPSRVQISDVQPGSAEVYHGQTVKVSAIVSGVRDKDPVTLRYRTADGQTVDRPVEMAAAPGGLRYECTLPPAEPGAGAVSSGVQQDLSYRIVAGDAESSDYRLTVIAAPTIIVERLEYQYPPYTRKAPETIPQQGDIKGLEGTKVTVHAVANQPIKSAWLEFDPAAKDAAPERLQLAADGMRAWGTITLQLKPDRQTPWHDSYQVRFYNARGQRSQQAVLHKIEVIRDLPPEVQILQPQRLRVEVPEDGEQTIEVRAVDPDFGLARLRIEGSVSGKPAIDVNLLDDDAGQPPQVTIPYPFRPREHKLAAGQELKYVAVAEDNRTGPQTGQPEPNIARTAEYTLVVIPPPKNNQGQGKTQAHSANEGQPPDKPRTGNEQAAQQPQPDPKNQQPMGQQADQQSKQSGDQQNKQDDKQKGQQDNQQQSGKQQSQPQQSGKSDGSQQGKSQDGQSPSSSSGGASAAGSPQQSDPNSGAQGASTGPGQGGGQSSGDRQQPAGQQDDRAADAQGQANGPSGPQGKAHDGEAIERVLKDLQRQREGEAPAEPTGQQSKGGSSQPDGGTQRGAAGQSQQGQQPMPGDIQARSASEAAAPNKPMPDNKQARSASEGNAADKAKAGNQQAPEQAQRQPMSDASAQGQQTQGQKSGAEPGAKPQDKGQSGAQKQNAPSTGQPGASDQQSDQAGRGERGEAEQGRPRNRLPDDKQGQDASDQKSAGNEGGAPKGPSKTDRGEKSSPSQGEKRDPGAGKKGDEGAGTASEEKSASGEGTRDNRDRPKEQKPDNGKPEQGEPSPASNSKRQSDSKGGQSGDESGGGKQGAGQSGGQQGNDSAGSKSAADQGTGRTNETGGGEIGSKAGTQQEAAGKTGRSGNQKGDGSSSRPDDQGQAASSPSGQPPQQGSRKERQEAQNNNPSDPGGKSGGPGPVVGGGEGNQLTGQEAPPPDVEVADAANLQYARKATEMVLKRLQDEEHNPDPDLLKKLGWTREDLAEFLRRWEALQKSAQATPDGKRELDEALRSLGLRDPAQRKRAASAANDSQRDLRDGGNRSSPPPKYRDLFDAFRKGAARSRE